MATFIARPEFDDTRLQDQIQWLEDNALLLSQFAHSLGYHMATDADERRYGEFLKSQWLHELRYYDPDKPECSICRRRHGAEIIHASE